jgi:2-furoate---CoA ligase
MLDLGRTFLQSLERSPGHVALIDGPLRLSYGEWAQRIFALCHSLRALGLRRGDQLLALLQNRWEAATLHWACQLLGVVITPLNWRAKADEIAYCLRDSESKAVVFEAVSAPALSEVAAAARLPRIAVGDGQVGTHSFSDLLSAPSAAPCLDARAEDLSVMLYTSGTTGAPKGVPRRHRSERAAAVAHVAQNRYVRGERCLGAMPLYHTMGVRALLSMALVDGCFVCLPRFDAGLALSLIEGEGITALYLVPTLYHDLLAHPAFCSARVATARKLGFAGAPMHEALLRRLHAAFAPEQLINHYGSSEVYTFTVEPNAVAKPGSAGRAGIHARVRVVALDGAAPTQPDQRVGPNEEGQIIAELAGDEAFDGYWKRPDADERSLRQGWYFTGDTGYVDADGDLFVTGRVDDMIISGGENISPVEIESVLSTHPGVDEVAVAGLRDERWGQRVAAFVKRRAGAAVDAAMLDAHCRGSQLNNFKRPREYIFVRELPRSPVGKLLRRKLVCGDFVRDDAP